MGSHVGVANCELYLRSISATERDVERKYVDIWSLRIFSPDGGGHEISVQPFLEFIAMCLPPCSLQFSYAWYKIITYPVMYKSHIIITKVV